MSLLQATDQMTGQCKIIRALLCVQEPRPPRNLYLETDTADALCLGGRNHRWVAVSDIKVQGAETKPCPSRKVT